MESCMSKLYLAGAIRDDHPEDVKWRTDTAFALAEHYHILNPLMGKSFHQTHGWLMHDKVRATGDIFVHRDLAMIHKADVMLANLSALADGYPCIGTLMELGIAMERRLLTVVVGPYSVCNHPFIAAMSYRRVSSVALAIDWLKAERAWM
jgi:nucleoside 2-deoxyribosyltransferase